MACLEGQGRDIHAALRKRLQPRSEAIHRRTDRWQHRGDPAQMVQRMARRGLEAEEIIEQRCLGRLDWRGFRVSHQRLGPRGDLFGGPEAHEGPRLLDQLRRSSCLEPLQQRNATGRHRRAPGKSVQERLEPLGAPDMPQQSRLASVRCLQSANRGHQDADVPRHRAQVQPRQQVAEQRKHLGIRRLGRGSVEHLIPHLKVFRRPTRAAHLLAEDLTQIGIPRRLRPMRHVRLHHGNSEVRPQHHLAAHRVVRHIGPRPDVFAIKV